MKALVIGTAVGLLILVLLVFIYLLNVYQHVTIKYSNFHIVGSSMAPIYQEGEWYHATNLGYTKSVLKRGDVIVYRNISNIENKRIARIIGLPGEEVVLSKGSVYINKSMLYEPYLPKEMFTSGGEFLKRDDPKLIPANTFFVLGDNRHISDDSRNFGFLPKDNIIAVVEDCYRFCKSGK